MAEAPTLARTGAAVPTGPAQALRMQLQPESGTPPGVQEPVLAHNMTLDNSMDSHPSQPSSFEAGRPGVLPLADDAPDASQEAGVGRLQENGSGYSPGPGTPAASNGHKA